MRTSSVLDGKAVLFRTLDGRNPEQSGKEIADHMEGRRVAVLDVSGLSHLQAAQVTHHAKKSIGALGNQHSRHFALLICEGGDQAFVIHSDVGEYPIGTTIQVEIPVVAG